MRGFRIKKTFLFWGLFLYFYTLGFGQSVPIKFEKFSEESIFTDGFRVTALFQDSKGYIWAGTLGGLYRYDGYEAKVFNHEPGDSTSLSDSKISKILEDEEGFLWIDTQNGLNRYNPANETFERIYHEITTGPDLNSDYVSPIGFADGNLWTFVKEGKLCKYDLQKRGYDHSHHNTESVHPIVDSIREWHIAQNGQIYLFRHDGFYLYNADKKDFDFYEIHLKAPTTKEVFYFMESPEGNMWMGSEEKLHLFNPTTKTFQRVEKFPDYHYPIRTEMHYFYLKDKNGLDWIGTSNGLFIFNHQTQSYQRKVKQVTPE